MKTLMLIALFLSEASLCLAMDRPANPEPGKCYTQVRVPASYRDFRESVLVKPESFRTTVIPAKYEMKTRRVVVEEGKETVEVIPATFKTVKERVLVSPEKRLMNPLPPKYEVVRKKVQVQPERYGWVKGEGPRQKVDENTGDILCYKKLPAVYKTVTERVLVSEASVSEKIIPAQYKVVSKRVVDRPSQSLKKWKPAVTKTVRVKTLVRPAEQRQVRVPAVYKTQSRREVVRPSRVEWRPILCQTNASPSRISQIQRTLAKAGFFRGPVTGHLGPITAKAVLDFQKSRGLATGGITGETLVSLGLPGL